MHALDPNEPNSLRKPFARWLETRWPDARNLSVGEIASPATGYSAQTLILPVSFEREGVACDEKVVLRIENPEPAIYPQQAPGLDVEIDIQYRAMEAIGKFSQVPLAPLIGYEADASILGSPFFAMGYVAGEVPVLEPLYTQAGFFAEAAPSDRRRMIDSGLAVLAELHRIDWREAGLGWLVPSGGIPDVRAQVVLWHRFALRELGSRVHPMLDRSFAFLLANVPEGLEPALSWGDSRPGNIIWQNFEPACLTDFENVAIAPAEVDLGWWLMFHRTCHEVLGVELLPGEPSIEEQGEIYAGFAGREPVNLPYFELLAAARYAAIVVRVMNRTVERGLLPADHVVWRENPPANLLEPLLERAN